jgi:hypothetical protein
MNALVKLRTRLTDDAVSFTTQIASNLATNPKSMGQVKDG